MPMIRSEQFGGQVPQQDARLLAGYHAAFAQNAYVGSGTIRPISALVDVHKMINPAYRSFFRVPKGNASIDNIIDSYWLEFPDENTWVVRNPTSDLTDGGRFYWADGHPPGPQMTTFERLAARQKITSMTWAAGVATAITETNHSISVGDVFDVFGVLPVTYPHVDWNGRHVAIAGTTGTTVKWALVSPASPGTDPLPVTTLGQLDPMPPLLLGIPAPTIAPGVTPSGGTAPVEARSYVYTWASGSHEEGPPSPPTIATGNANGTWHITMTAPTVEETTDRNLKYTRIYRTVTSSQGVATYFFVVELPITTLAFDDAIPNSVIALNDALQSTNWLPPPIDLNGMVNMANGMIAGFRDTEIWFCEPYRPHAWPPQYVLSVESEIVGLGVQQQSLVIMTVGWTYIATGIRPSAMALTKVSTLEPCTSMGSIVSAPEGVMYTSVNGLMIVASGVAVNGTANMVRKDQWSMLLYLPNLHATYINRSYLAFSSPSDGVFQTDTFQVGPTEADPAADPAFATVDFQGTRNGAVISLSDEHMAYMRLASVTPVVNVIQDVWTGESLILRDGEIIHVDLRKAYPRLSNYLWRSKIFQTPYKENWAAVRIFCGPPPGGSDFPPDGPTYFRFYADGRMIYQRQIDTSGNQFRLPSGYKSDFVQWEVEGQLEIFNVQFATSARELRNA